MNEILCLDCNKKFVGETCRSLNKRIYKHKRNLQKVDLNNSLIKHNLETNPDFNFENSKKLVYIHYKLLNLVSF